VVAFTTVNDVAAVPPKLTDVAPVRLVPVMVTVDPLPALVGVNEEMVGAAINVNPAKIAVPPGVVTLTLPEVPIPTTAVIVFASTTVNDVAAVPPKLTAVAPVRFVPVIVTVDPLPALVGVSEEMVGAGEPINVNPAKVAVPPGVVTLILPEAPAPTTAVIVVAFTTVNDVAAVPPKLTAVAPVRFVPVIVTADPLPALVGVSDEMVGTAINVNPAKVTVPPGVVTLTLPEVPVPTTAVMVVAFTTVNDVATVPPKLTAVAPVKLVPVMVTVVPLPTLVGVNEEMVGAAINVNPPKVAVPPGVVTLTLPEVPIPTTAVIVFASTTVNDVAAVPPKLTAVAPVRLVPVMVTVVPELALVGVNEEMVGAGEPINVNPAKVAVPPGVVTLTLPDAPTPTSALIILELSTVNDVAAVPPKLTAVAPPRFVPEMVINVPELAVVGPKKEIVGATININPAKVAVPPGVVTLTLPKVPAPSTAVMVFASTTVNDVAAVPPKRTVVAPVRFVPVIVTVEPLPALVGVNEEMVGAGDTINVNPAKVAVPPGVVTLTLPEAPVPTTAVMVVAFTTVNDVVAVPPKRTVVAPVRFVPVIVTVVPELALVGVKEEMVGATTHVNPAKVAVPPGVVTLIVPEAPAPTTAVIVVAFTTVNDVAAVPPKLTAVAPARLVPVIVTVDPLPALAGVKDVIVGGAPINVNPAKVAVPPGVVTLTLPEAPAPTTAVMVVAFTTVNDVAAVPPKFTAVAPIKFVPVIVTVAPTPVLVGVNEEMIGAAKYVKLIDEVAVSTGVVTLTKPEDPVPTQALIVVEFRTVNDVATVPPK